MGSKFLNDFRNGIKAIRPLAAMRSNRRGQRHFNGPAAAKAMADCICAHPESFCPLLDRQGLSMKCQHSARASIVVLLFGGTPFNISRRVMTVIVDAINRMLATWSGSDVSIESYKRLAPALTDRDAPASIQ